MVLSGRNRVTNNYGRNGSLGRCGDILVLMVVLEKVCFGVYGLFFSFGGVEGVSVIGMLRECRHDSGDTSSVEG